QAAARRAMQVRRWRRAAIATCGLAASLAIVVLLRVEVRVEAQQLTIRWGKKAVEERTNPTVVERVVTRDDSAALAALDDRVRLLDDLVHALITDVGDRDERQTHRVARLRDRVEELLARNSQRLGETERNLAAVVTALSFLPKKGDKP